MTHITSVSGGSIIAAHLVLNWDRYNGSPNEFDAAAAELLAFMRLDVRNRIVRRFPLASRCAGRAGCWGCSNRKLTRTGLLEYHYEKYLYGDTSLFELPERPQLHILATNLSEGCLCSFNRNGLLMMRRQPGNTVRIDRIRVGLATVPMAVTASSAFPGFFPPLELTGADVGASGGEFGRQAYTDGGVFDNLGVRMFRCLERPLLADSPLSRDDFFDFPAVVEAPAAGRQVQRGNAASPARADPGGGRAAGRTCCRLTGVERSGGAGLPADQRAGQSEARLPLPSPSQGRQRRRSGIVLPILLGRPAPLPVAPRAALRRPEARGPRGGSAPPGQPFWTAAYWTPAIRSG